MKWKKFTLVLFVSLFSLVFSSFAQSTEITSSTQNFDYSKKYVGISASGGWGGYFGFAGSIGARYGYYLSDRFAMGADINYDLSTGYYKYFRPGVHLKYHFNDHRISPFLETGIYQAIGKKKFDQSETWRSDNFTEGRIGVGVNLQGLFKDKVSFEPLAGYSTKNGFILEMRFLLHY